MGEDAAKEWRCRSFVIVSQGESAASCALRRPSQMPPSLRRTLASSNDRTKRLVPPVRRSCSEVPAQRRAVPWKLCHRAQGSASGPMCRCRMGRGETWGRDGAGHPSRRLPLQMRHGGRWSVELQERTLDTLDDDV